MFEMRAVKRALISLLAVVPAMLFQVPGQVKTQQRVTPAADSPTTHKTDWSPMALGEPLTARPEFGFTTTGRPMMSCPDNIPLTEELAMRELREILRLRKSGVHFDYYMMDAFWFDPDGGYRTWRKPNWPDGPDQVDRRLPEAAGIKPGLWFSTSTLVKINAAPQWRASVIPQGGRDVVRRWAFLADFMSVLQFWYDRGVRAFKFDLT